MSTTVVVIPPFQCVHRGTVYGPGDTAEVPDEVAREWIAHGWAEGQAKAPPRKGTSAK
jgi:hypothetical protein